MYDERDSGKQAMLKESDFTKKKTICFITNASVTPVNFTDYTNHHLN